MSSTPPRKPKAKPAVSEVTAGSASARVFAYCRVSTSDQSTTNQVQEIQSAGFTVQPQRVIAETVSGSVAATHRGGFKKLLDKMETGDVLVVTKLDRLGRSAMDVRQTVDLLGTMSVRVHCLALGGMDLTSAAGRMTMQVLSAVAEFERDLLIERTQAGLTRAKSEGVQLGRPATLSATDRAGIRKMLAEGVAVAVVARQFNVSRTHARRVKNAHQSNQETSK